MKLDPGIDRETFPLVPDFVPLLIPLILFFIVARMATECTRISTSMESYRARKHSGHRYRTSTVLRP